MKTYMIRTCYFDMTSYGGFPWPESGPVVCPDWDPRPYCGNGLHGLLLGCGDGGLLNWSDDAKWLVVEINREDIVDLGGKIKVPRGTVIYSGPRKEAIAKLEALAPECLLLPVVGATRTAGYEGSATAGDEGHATAGDYGSAMAGFAGTATAGYEGKAAAGEEGTATAGAYGTATVGNEGSAIAGNGGTAIAGEGGKATAGYEGTAIAGYMGTAITGECGEILIKWYDTKTSRKRTSIGYVGEDGIEANKPYRVDPDTGKLVPVE